MSFHAEDYKNVGARVLSYVNTKPGIAVVAFILGAIALRLYRG